MSTPFSLTNILRSAVFLLPFYTLPIQQVWSFHFTADVTDSAKRRSTYTHTPRNHHHAHCQYDHLSQPSSTRRIPRIRTGSFFPLYSASSAVIGSDSGTFNNTILTARSTGTVDSMAQEQRHTQIRRPGKAAVILNTNARAVNDKVVRLAKQVFGDRGCVFVTTCAEEAEAAARCIVAGRNNIKNINNQEENYQLVVPVGGDGTLTATIDCMVQAILEREPHLTLAKAIQKVPVIGYVPLGTGNGVGSVVGCTLNRKIRRTKQLKQVFEALQQVAATSTVVELGCAPQMETSIVELPMMQVITNTATAKTNSSTISSNGDLCFFAGVGFDSLMLNDYKNMKAWSKKTGFLPSFLSSVAGYCVALVVKTLPNALFHRKHNIHVTVTTPPNVDPGETLWVDHRRGDFVQKCHSPVLFQGETGILAAGTAPFYGGGLRLFPFARLTVDKMHLRLGRISPLTGFFNIPRIFAGSYRDTTDRMGVLDFIGSEFDVRVEGKDGRGFPLQHSGESVGDVEHFRLRVVEEPVQFISFLPRRK